MNRKRKHTALTVIFSLLAILLLFGVLLCLGVFHRHPIEIGDATSPYAAELAPRERIVRPVTAALPGKGCCSELMDGVMLDMPRDIVSAESAEDVLAQLYQAFVYYRNVGADTVFICPDASGRLDALRGSDGTAFDALSAAVSYARQYGYYTVLTVDESLLEQAGTFDYSRVSELLSRYGFDALYYRPAGGENDDAFRRTAERIRQSVEAGGSGVSFGCAVYSDPAHIVPALPWFSAFFADNTADFVCVCPRALTGSAPFSFGEEMAAWNGFASRYADTVFYCAYALDKVLSAPSPGEEMRRQLDVMCEQEYFRGGVYCATAALLRSPSAARQISAYYYREDPYDFAVDSLSFAADGASVVFGGRAVEGRKLTIDRTVIAPEGGPFAVSCALIDGENRFLLRNAGYQNRFLIEKVADADGGRAAQPSPYRDNGLGRALMCRVDTDLTQAMARSGVYDTFCPDYSDLPAGTLDYVEAIAFDEGVRYELKSGLSVSAWDATLLSGAYALPDNTVRVIGADDSNPRRTEITLGTDWFVPVTLTLSPQPYQKGYRDFSYNIALFSAAYLDVILHDTARVLNADRLAFPASSVISGAEVVFSEGGLPALRLYLRDPAQFCGAYVSHDVNGDLVITVRKKAASLTAAKVMLDPGHGGLYMTGTALNDDSLSEKEVTLDIARKVRDLLRAQGIDVELTREDDVSLTLRERKERCAAYAPDVFVSIHCDGVDDMGQSGTHSFYFKPFSQPLAASIHQRLVEVYSSVIYTAIDKNYDQIDKSIKYYPFYVTRTDCCPSVLVEAGFMSNDYEGKILADENCRNWIADAIASGVVDYLMLGGS